MRFPKYTAEICDIRPYLSQEVIPEKVLPRPQNTVWRVRKEPMELGETELATDGWAYIRDGDLVRIPLVPYRTAKASPSHVVLSAMELGMRYAASYPECVRIHVIVGDPVEDLSPEGVFRFWLGVAVQQR
jgi:hypothetical protein